ncbi:unnamed protein product [Symbiodinium natans]|uniref:Uncharacterized protein n=1 Tax=Symbiodinium natans TaxID=878477 RepID=A0A812UVX6_9DINO|nr:unnamed protein product [Symbiodinium natans]
MHAGEGPGPPLELLRATAAALHGSGCWDAALLAEVVRTLDRLAPNQKPPPSGCFVELAEHRCLLLRLSMAMAGTASAEVEPRRSHTLAKPPPAPSSPHSPSFVEEAATLPNILNQSADWRGRYKLKRHTDTWFKAKWQIQFNLNFSETGSLYVTVRWPKFGQPAVARLGRWYKDTGGRGGIAITFEAELPEGRREGGRTRDGQVFSWQGHLVCSRGCPHLEGTARSRVSDLSYEWYVVPPEPLSLLRAPMLDLFGEPDETLMRPYSLLSFNIGFSGPKMEHFAHALRLTPVEGKEPATPLELAAAAVANRHQYSYVHGPPSVGKASRQGVEEETFGLCQTAERHEGDADSGQGCSAAQGWESLAASQARWCSTNEVLSLIGGEQDLAEGSGDEVQMAEPAPGSVERSPTARTGAAVSGDTTERSMRSRVTESPGARSTRSFPLLIPPPLRRASARGGERPPCSIRANPPLGRWGLGASSQRFGGDAQKNEESARQLRLQALSAALDGEDVGRERQLRYAILMRILEVRVLISASLFGDLFLCMEKPSASGLQDLLAPEPYSKLRSSGGESEPSQDQIGDFFVGLLPDESKAFLYRALQLRNSEQVLARLSEDFAASEELMKSALVVAMSGLVAPFTSKGPYPRSSITVDTDHEYHPNEAGGFNIASPAVGVLNSSLRTCGWPQQCREDVAMVQA